jgi:uncharacterized membrane protein YidH (DUF202 family)
MDKDIRKPAPPKSLLESSAAPQMRVPGKSKSKDKIEVVVPQEDDEVDETAPLLGEASSVSKDSRKGKGSLLSSWQQTFTSKPDHANSQIPYQMNQKRIILPVRIEPKVFFANERTFLSWLHFCIVLGGLALGLLNFGDPIAQISGLVFTAVSMIFMLYALFLYQWRAHKIRTRGRLNNLDSAPYDDRVGPVVLVFTLFAAVIVNFYLKFTH